MKKITVIFIFGLLFSLGSSLEVVQVETLDPPVVVNQISVRDDSSNTNAIGSSMGGTTLYIKGTGFDKYTDSLYTVTVGGYPCHIDDGSTATMMVCKTSSTGQYRTISNQEIKISISGVGAVDTSSVNTYTYSTNLTPYLYTVTPAVNYGDKEMFWYGVHRIDDLGYDDPLSTGDLYALYIGESQTDLHDLEQDTITANGAGFIKSMTAEQQQAGHYTVKEHNVAGYSYNFPLMTKASYGVGKEFEYVVMPAIEETTNSGAVSGNTLTIKGSGFSPDTSDIQVAVGDVPCAITASTLDQITCELEAKAAQDPEMTSNAATPANNFESGSGFAYQRYDMSSTGTNVNNLKTLIDAQNFTDMPLVQSAVRGEIKSQGTYGNHYGQVWKGYFIAPSTGTYTFRARGDDQFAVYVTNETHNSTVEFANNDNRLLYVSSYIRYSNVWANFYQDDRGEDMEKSLDLVAYNRYYMEVYHTQSTGGAFFELDIEIPNSDTTVEHWQSYEVHKFTTSATFDPEIVKFNISSGGAGQVIYQYITYNPSTLKVTTNTTATLDYDATASDFCSKWDDLTPFRSTTLSCTRVMYDSDHLVTTDPTMAAVFEYEVTVNTFRTNATRNLDKDIKVWKQINNTSTATISRQEVQVHSPLINGTFTMTVAGNPVYVWNNAANAYDTFLPYDISESTLRGAIENALRNASVIQDEQPQLVRVVRNGDEAGEGATWIIYYIGVNQDIPDLVFDTTQLGGGKAGLTPTINFEVRREYSPNILVEPIDYRFMSTHSTAPSVRVTVNNVPSVCLGDCSYTFISSEPQVSSVSLTGSTLTIGLANTLGSTHTLNDLSVKFDKQACTNLVGTLASFTCDLPTNTDNSPIIRAGDHLPVVTVQGVGVLTVQNTVTAITQALSIASITPATGENNGGYEATLAATGLPLLASQAQFTICNTVAPIKSISNIEAVVTIPECGTAAADTMEVQYNSLTATTPFTYTTTTTTFEITSIDPTSASPVLKSVMTINGNGFGTDVSALTVHLTNATGEIYQMRVLTATDTQIKVGISGGLPGPFEVQVNKNGAGNAVANPATANDFVYEVVVDSVSPTSGSAFGGTLITLSGKNFIPDDKDESMVTIGNELNQLCKIETITKTQITCRTPAMHQDEQPNTDYIVLVNNKLRIDSTCGVGPCNFSYITNTSSPMVTNASRTWYIKDEIILEGERFDLDSTADVVMVNRLTQEETVLSRNSYNATSINASLANSIEAGFYYIKVRLDQTGDSNMLPITAGLEISGVVQNQVSVHGGRVTIQGRGFPATWPNTHYNHLFLEADGKAVQLNVQSISTEEIVINLPKGYDGRAYKFTISNPDQSVTKTVSFTQRTSGTPSVTVTSPSAAVAPGTVSVTLAKDTLSTVDPELVQVYSVSNPNYILNISSPTISTTQITFDATLNSGQYGFKLFNGEYGWYSSADFIDVSQTGAYTVASITSSYNGGRVTVSGADIGQGAVVIVHGQKGEYVSSTATEAIFEIPKLITPTTFNEFNIARNKTLSLKSKVKWGDTENWEYAFDGDHSSNYAASANNTDCQLGIDMGANVGAYLTRIRYFPSTEWAIASNVIQDGVFQGSNTNSSDPNDWTDLATIDQSVHAGWNSFMIDDQTVYRYIRFVHTNQSQCKLAEFELTGVEMSQATVADSTSHLSDLVFDDGVTTQTFTNAVEYRKDNTARVTAINPIRGDVFGGYDITLTGEYLNLGSGNPSAFIDGVECVYVSHTATQIVCTVGARLTIPDQLSFKVQVGDVQAITEVSFDYVLRWSDIRTWGTDPFPIADDMVYVPKNMRLLVDESTPVLKAIVVDQGILEFADEKDMVIEAQMITVKGGKFIAGTKEQPYQHNLKFVMHGNYWLQQQPIFGNKGIGCFECDFSMQGKTRTPTWTTIDATIQPGDTSFTVSEDVDWVAGESIVVASTSYDHNEAEQMIIDSVAGRVITVKSAFKYMHFGEVETYGTDSIDMKAQVGLLTRNIQMMGDDDSVASDYGSHLLLAGSAENGLVGKIAYVEFSKCGQPQIPGRYCHHFHLNGDVPESYSIGNSVHNSMARILTLHGVHYLYVAWNVGYRVKGHNFFVEDGIETNNVLEHNLAISSLTINNMLQTDISVASFWITHPKNHVRFNRAAGGDFYGFWYEIKPKPDGPSATSDVCPQGQVLGESHDNVAHSYVRFGLRIFRLSSRKFPCQEPRNDALEDPWEENPSIESKFYNYVTYKNGESGLLAEETGHTVFENFVIAQSSLAGMEFYRNNLTRQDVIAKNVVIIGKSTGNSDSNTSHYKGAGAILPRSGTMDLDGIRFHSFASTQRVWEACSKCDNKKLYSNMGVIYKAKNIEYSDINASTYYKMLGLRKEIFYDLDGSLMGDKFDGTTRTSGTLVWGFEHIKQDNTSCHEATTPSSWNNAVLCDDTVAIQQIAFTNLKNKREFQKMPIKIRKLADVSEVVDENETIFTKQWCLFGDKESKEQKETYSFPFIAGNTYNVWWASGLDWDHVAIDVRYPYDQTQDAVIIKFNYTENRELYEIGPQQFSNKLQKADYITQSTSLLDAATCTNGEYYHNNDENLRVLHVCASSKNKKEFQYISLNAIYCRYLCPAPPGTFVKENFVRLWSNTSTDQWPNGLPQDGDNVTINGNWTMIMDVNPPRMDYFLVQGDLIIEDKFDVNITAEHIWVKYGSLKAGSADEPITNHTITFQINGNKNDPSLTIDPQLTGNKQFVVTGTLELYGDVPATQWTKLKAYADANATQIQVLSASGWAVGDTIAIAPSFSGRKEFEERTIAAISGTTITLDSPLTYAHYGASSATIEKSYGTLDTRAAVGHLNRKIKFTAGADSGWGYSVVQYAYNSTFDNPDDPNSDWIITTGNMKLSGVEFENGGKYDTEDAALQIRNIRLDPGSTLIEKSSFHGCQDMCVRVDNVFDVEFSKNVFFNGRKILAQVENAFNFKFNDNLMIGAQKRPSTVFKDLIACLNMYQAIDMDTNLISVQNNLCQGSEGHGFAIPTVKCTEMDDYPFVNNIAGSTQVGFILNKASGSCIAAKGLMAYASQIGQIMNPAVPHVKFSEFIMADNQRALSLRVGGDSGNKTAEVDDSYITAISRPDCSECYGSNATICSNLRGVRMMAIGSNSESLPDKFGTGFDVICKEETINGKAFSKNVEFNQWKTTYSTLPQCSGNKIFFPHTTSDDVTGSHHFWNSNCTDCEESALANFIPPDPSKLGWFGGCGTILCTGMNNYLIYDYDGGLLQQSGQPGVLLANNSWIGEGENCKFISEINGYYCDSLDFGVLQYESLVHDVNPRVVWPVYLFYDANKWTSETNAWIEWEWEGGEPLNKRKSRFVSVIKLHETYNMTFSSMPPKDMVFQFQRRSLEGNSSDYAIIMLHYPQPNSIRVQANRQTVKPISLLDNNGETPIDETVCGSNKFFWKNYTIHFAVHAANNCRVRVSLVNSIQLTARFAMPITDFFQNDGATKFINRMSALLGITDTSRIKIVGIYSGSTVVVTNIDEEPVPEEDAGTVDSTTRATSIKATKALIDQTLADGSFAEEMVSAGLGSVESVQASTILVEEEAAAEDDQTGLIIGVTLGALLLVILLLVSAVAYMRKRAKIGSLGVTDQVMHLDSDDKSADQAIKINSEDNFSHVDFNAQKKELY